MNNDNTELVTLEDLQLAVPSKKNTITQQAVDIINKSMTEPEFQGESLLRTAATYESVLQRNKASIVEYLNAIRFCAYMVSLDDNFTEAYKKTFYDRDFVKERASEPTHSPKYKELTSAASRYRKSKVVVDILTVSQVPLDLIFGGHRMKAVGVLAELMESAKYDKDRISAAKELLAATKNEDKRIELSVGMNSEAKSLQESLDKQLNQLANNQLQMLNKGYSIGDVQKTGIQLDVIEGELDE